MRIYKMPFGEKTEQGSYFIKDGGDNIGYEGRSHFETKEDAQTAVNKINALRYRKEGE